jgi:hypothetical protein
MTLKIAVLLGVLLVVAIILSALKGRIPMPYKVKLVLSKPEQVLFHRIVAALPDCVVLAQVQMSSFLAVTATGRVRQAALNRILMKSMDFLVCRKDLSIIAAIELQDGTHARQSRRKNDEFKRAALEAAHLRLVEYHVSRLPSLEEIKETFSSTNEAEAAMGDAEKSVSAVEKERDELKSGLQRAELEKHLAEKSLKEKYETQIKLDATSRCRTMTWANPTWSS